MNNEYLPVRGNGIVARVQFLNIIYIENCDRDIEIVTDKMKFREKGKISEILKELDGRFYSPHRSYIVNMDHVAMVDTEGIVMSNGDEIKVCRSLLLKIKKEYWEYINKR